MYGEKQCYCPSCNTILVFDLYCFGNTYGKLPEENDNYILNYECWNCNMPMRVVAARTSKDDYAVFPLLYR